MNLMDKILTLDYYDRNALSFSESTLSVDMKEVEDIFLSYLGKGGKILDLGCGSGRDSIYFQSKGYDVTPADGSMEICRIAEKNTGIPVRHMLFQDIDYVNEFDGVWACSSLLHSKKEDLRGIFSLIHNALNENGIFYSSFKFGTFEGMRNGRYFTDMDEESFLSLADGLFRPEKIWLTQDARKDRKVEKWLIAIVRKMN